MKAAITLFAVFALGGFAQTNPSLRPCRSCAEWNQPQRPFRVFGNTYYVGTHNLASILITSSGGHILIDGDLPESAPQIADHIRELGFHVKDVKLILNSHVHFDHAGGIAQLQRLSGAQVAASPWTANVLNVSGLSKDDPQFTVIRPTPLVKNARVIADGETLRVGTLAVTAHFTPGHTPGGTSWTWQSCENGTCRSLVYADSLTAVSEDGFRFSDSPNAVHDFEKSFAFLRQTPCDILLTPHPDFSKLWERVRDHSMLSPGACRDLADRSEKGLRERLASEKRK